MTIQHFSPQVPPGELLQKLFDSLNEIVCVIDTQGCFVYINQACYKIWGYRPEELIGISCFNLIVEEERATSFRDTRDSYDGKVIPTYENHYYHKDGHIITMFWEGGWDFGEGLLYSTGKDISEQRRLEKLEQEYKTKLETTKSQLEHLIDRITDGFLGLDEHQRVIYWNKAAENISRLSQEEMVGHVLWDVLPEPTKTLARQQLAILQAQNRPLTIEFFSKRVKIWIEVNAYISGTGVSVFFRDITERKKLQEQLLQEKERLHQEKELQQRRITTAVIKATEEERALVGKELHDNVNQVLTTVKLYNELCLTGIDIREELLKKSVQLLQDSINEIRGLSKRLSAPSLGGIRLKDSVAELVEAINAANRVKVFYEQDVMDLDVSEEVHIAVYRILQEHFTNILKHARASTARVRLTHKKQELGLIVTDNGRGFDPSQYSKGIGVENMMNRAESVNGKLRLISAPGQGCTLNLTIPLRIKIKKAGTNGNRS